MEYLKWLKEQLQDCKMAYLDRYCDNEYYIRLDGEIDAYETAIEELEDRLEYVKGIK